MLGRLLDNGQAKTRSHVRISSVLALASVFALAVAVSSAVARAQTCAADCDASGLVAVNELVSCVNVALGRAELSTCVACDIDGDTSVSISDIYTGVNALLGGCPVAPGAIAHFGFGNGGTLDWGDVPFPSDLYRDGNGAIRIGGLPVTNETQLHAAMRSVVQERDGFCATCNIHFAIDGEIDRSTLPAGDAATTSDGVVLVDVDPASPERGRLFPLRIQWDAARNRLSVRPIRGIALHGRRRYAAALTTTIHATDGSPLRASEVFLQVRSQESSSDPVVELARTVLAPALDELEAIGISRDRVVALAAFTTEDIPADILSARAAVQTGTPLEVVIERRRRGAEIDDLLGVPSEDRPGIDVPPATGVAGTRSIVHDSIAEVIAGYFIAPRIVSGTGIDIGTALRDEQGHIVAGPLENVPFVLTLPATAASTIPIVVAHHGFNASRTTGFASANTAASVGVAVLAIDAFQHGNRAASATDTVNAMRDIPGADGFAETEMLDLSARVFGLLGAAPGLALFPGYSLGAFLQFAADVESAVRVIREDSLAEALRQAGVEDLAGFDTQRIGFIGNSLGAVVGASVLVAEPDVRFAVQNVQPGSIVETLVESPEFRGFIEVLYFPAFDIRGPFDEVQRQLIFEPMVDFSRWILEPVDPLALAPHLLLDPVRPNGAPEILFQVASLDEVAAPLATASMLEATGSTNVTRYDPAAHGMLEVLNQSSKYVPPAVPPFMFRPAEIPVANPIVAIHDEIATFLTENLSADSE